MRKTARQDLKDKLQLQAMLRDSQEMYQEIGIELEDGYDAEMLEEVFR
jgi:hypothetical protein